MHIGEFVLERYFARHEFTARYLLSSSDCEPLTMDELLGMADTECHDLWRDLKLGYTESPGHPLLRQEIADQYAGLDPDDVLVAAPEECIFLLMHALLDEGDHVVCTMPGYQSLYEVARSIGCEVTPWTPCEGSPWRFDVADLERAMRRDTRLVVCNFPHNPTGAVPSRVELGEILDLAVTAGAYLLSDEMYRGLELGAAATLPPACTLGERVVTLGGLSKSYGLPGLRIGWLAGADRDSLRKVAALKDYTTICNGAPNEILALIGLRSRSAIVARQLDLVSRNLVELEHFVSRNDGVFGWRHPAAGSVCFARIHVDEGAARFCEDLVDSAGIMLVPSTVFAYGDEHVRFGFGRQDLPEVLGRLQKYLDGR